MYSCVLTCFRFVSTLNMLLCLLFCFVSLIQSSSKFPRIHFSPVCEFLVIPCNCSHSENGSFEVLSLHEPLHEVATVLVAKTDFLLSRVAVTEQARVTIENEASKLYEASP